MPAPQADIPPIRVDATERSPEVDFDFAAGRLAMSGESYPEDAAAFFGPLLKAVRDHVTALDGAGALTVDLRMVYFNSSSAKALMNLFQVLEDAARTGTSVTINWHFEPEDDTMEEFGEDFSDDFEAAAFNLCPDL